MVHLKDVKNQLPNEIKALFSELKVTQFLKQAHISKQKGYSVAVLFTFLFSLVFKGKTLNQVLSGREGDQYMKKDIVYRWMNDPHNNWRLFLLRFSASVIEKLHALTDTKTHLRTLILDDSTFYRNRSQEVPGLARLWDHALKQGYKGYRMLTLGFSDGYSFIPIDFGLLSGQKKVNQAITEKDQRTVGAKRFKESSQKMPEVALEMVQRALDQGIYATHVLMDKWFTSPKMMDQLHEMGIHTIGMVKNGKTQYLFHQRLYKLEELYAKSTKEYTQEAIISSIVVKPSSGKNPVKIVFVKNHNKKSAWLAIMTDDLDLSSQEIVKTYSVRWDIETFFKASKSLLNLTKETQTRHYQALICHTTIVFTRYILLSWQQRCANDERTLGGLFYELGDQIKELDWSAALIELVHIIQVVSEESGKQLQDFITSQLQHWVDTLPHYIKAYLPNLVCET
ncbi:transposase [Tetragenococcus koreensis]|uniref:Transposase n=2 Tax=Tetragenococcus koreensis TaxID=290335 RepID=A0AAN4UB67_9ENTE|nr:transposase [Tetragenococcus koreensis]AYW45772.1 transposase [Tetragenococcus koreensis]MCF1584413.1 transposase [Tetragenococcus koreensis]MCF1613962.1 transposase [Tetragenococcus koreensis]MCF1616768.1 transposase [Tetragenococcus koreensis]MCF1619823.1 transposase [Tetragenococcus koreensis]